MIWTELTETTRVFRHETLLRLCSNAVLHLYWRFFLMLKKKKKCDKPSPFAASLRRLFTHLLVCCIFPLNWSESCRLHVLPSKHRCEEPLVWTVIPLLKPWAEPYSNTPDAINDSTCATMLSLHSQITMCSFFSMTSPRHPVKVLYRNQSFFRWCFRIIQSWELPSRTGDWSVTAHASHLELHSTQLDSLRVLPVSF